MHNKFLRINLDIEAYINECSILADLQTFSDYVESSEYL